MAKNHSTKVCTRCHQEKPTSDFSPRGNGFMSWCKECRRKAYPARKPKHHKSREFKTCSKCKRLLPATTEYFHRASYQGDGLNPHCKECRRAYYYDNHDSIREKNSKASLDWWRRNKEHCAQVSREWGLRNRHKTRASFQRRMARKRSLPDTLTGEDWQRAIDYFHGCCAVCGRQLFDLFGTINAAADHWIPLASPDCPGTVATNIVPLCNGRGGCNTSKNDKDALAWLISQYGKRKATIIMRRVKEYFEWVGASTELMSEPSA